MGREYFGDISGKFGFGIQSSCDIQNLIPNIAYEQEYVWYGCGCTVDDPENTTLTYCLNCYEDYEQQFQDVEDWIDDVGDEQGPVKMFNETSQILFTIKKSEHFVPLLEALAELKSLLPPIIIDQFSKIEDHEEIVDGYSKIYRENIDHETIDAEIKKETDPEKVKTLWEYYFRYSLGLQIKYVLLKQEECFVSCET